MVDSETRGSTARGWVKFFAAMFVIGVVFGAAIGLTSVRGNTEYITDGIGYDVREQWYVHALVIGLSFVVVAIGLWFALFLFRIFGPFLPGAIVMTGLGATAVALGVLGVGELDTGLRILFVVMGVVSLALAAAAWRSAFTGRRS